MNKVRLTKEFKFEMAHALDGYDGSCRFIHGHSYEMWVTVIGTPIAGKTNPKQGMVIDFGDLKKIVRNEITDPLDHALMLNRNTVSPDLKDSHERFSNIIFVDYQPTSENMLIDFAARLKPLLPENVKLFSLKLRETITSYAEWFADDNAE